MIDYIDINGIVSEMHIIGKYNLSSLNRFIDIYLDDIKVNVIIIIFISMEIGIIEKNRSFVLQFFSDIILERVVGYENTANVLKSEVVGDKRLNKPIASVPRFLVIIIFSIKPISLLVVFDIDSV